MKTAHRQSQQGIALMVVMIAIFVLSALAAAFAYAMKVETKLAMNANNDTAVTYLGLSGVEFARWVLAQQLNIPAEPYDSLNQKWAGGPGSLAASNSPLAEISLDNFPVGAGVVSIKITDLERKLNVNMADERLLEQVLTLVGVDGGEIPAISSAILDWIDPDDVTHINGAETDYYQSQDPPYFAKNRPMDDLSELLLVRGVTLDMFWGSVVAQHAPAAFQKVDRFGRPIEQPLYTVGLADVFTTLSSGRININTASATVLQALPGLDENSAAQIVELRSGPDGVEGTEDDTPFRNVGEAAMAVNPQLQPILARYCDVRSRTFEVKVEAEINGYKRDFYAVIGRNNPRDIQLLSFYWK
jgi:general secretion pathway protein K